MIKAEDLQNFTTRTAWIGDREVDRMNLHVEQEMIYVGPSTSKTPDLNWTYTDRAGHWHAWADDGSHPTFTEHTRRVVVFGIDEDDDSYVSSSWYACSLCDQVIKPNFMTKRNNDHIPGMTSWRVEATMSKPPIPKTGDQTVIRLVVGDAIAFGIAAITEVSYDGTAHVTLMGMGPLAYRHGRDA
jgi:hypothetical protein